MKKKILTIVLASALVVCLGTTAFAYETDNERLIQGTTAGTIQSNPGGAFPGEDGEDPSVNSGQPFNGTSSQQVPGNMPSAQNGQAPAGMPGQNVSGNENGTATFGQDIQMPPAPFGQAAEGSMPQDQSGMMPALPSNQSGTDTSMPENGMPAPPDGQFMEGDIPGQNTDGDMMMPEEGMPPFGMNGNTESVVPKTPMQGEDAPQNSENGFMRMLRELYMKLKAFFGGEDGTETPSVQGPVPGGENTGSFPPAGQQTGAGMNNPEGMPSSIPGQMNGGAPGNSSYSGDRNAAQTVTGNESGKTYSSTAGNENAVLVSGSDVTLTDFTLTKTGSSSGDDADFYGTNAGILASDGATLNVSGADITTNGTHANGVFSYGNGTTVNISDSVITTSASNSGGIMTTGGATMNATNLTVNTSGNSSAAIRSDRGGGTVNVQSGSYTSTGTGSPAVYSTADITVKDAELTATTSEAVVIEGGNSVTIVDSDVSGNNSKLNGQSTVKTNVLIYQSMSGDASEGSSSFTMEGGKMTAGTGAMFHVTNVSTVINLSGVDFEYASDSKVFLDASADSWGTSGKNGGNVVLNLDDQDITGIITADSSSSVAVNMSNGSTWTLTGDSYITSLSGDVSGIDLNGYTLYVNGSVWSR